LQQTQQAQQQQLLHAMPPFKQEHDLVRPTAPLGSRCAMRSALIPTAAVLLGCSQEKRKQEAVQF